MPEKNMATTSRTDAGWNSTDPQSGRNHGHGRHHRPHPKYRASPTSGYRLLEHAYAELIQKLPEEIKTVVPVWDQINLEEFHSRYVDGMDMAHWDRRST